MIRCYIGLGSNLSEPVQQLRNAISALQLLPDSHWRHCSAFYRSAPLAGMMQPDYINAVAAIDTTLSASHLLLQLHTIEAAQGRLRNEKWAARTLDLDLLLYGNMCSDAPALRLPHPGLTQRAFVILPLLEIAPDLRLPDGSELQSYVSSLTHAALERLP